jgi:flagellar motor protein MotB
MKSDLHNKLSSLYERCVLDRARALASAGDFRHAEELLDNLEKATAGSGEACDVRARICAQTGRYEKARESWLKARDLLSAPQGYAAELAALGRYERWPALMSIRRLSPLIIVVVMFGIFAGGVVQYSPRKTAPVEPQLHIADALVTYHDRKIELRFEYGLFERGAVLNVRARKTLEALALQVKGSAQPYTIFIMGHTNDLPLVVRNVYPDNYALGLARAQAVLMYLRSDAGLRDARFVLGSTGEDDPPFPNDAREGRHRNMTVTIVLSPDHTRES